MPWRDHGALAAIGKPRAVKFPRRGIIATPRAFALARPCAQAYKAAMTGLCFIHRITGPAL
ncbi:hypothetical protein ACFSM0_11020 [Rhodobacter lacus]|uniref:Uncharacterized protein n=2 Tax=Rhodobacter lacus TaxID=1641972 RepID=A0ABW5AAV4_9RHOB